MNTLSSTRRRMTRDEALAWNSDWSAADVSILGESFDRVGAHTFYRTQSNGSLTVQDKGGRPLMYIHPGYVTFREGLAPEDREDPKVQGFNLSTVQTTERAPAKGEEQLTICPDCFYALPYTGVCDTCN
ncbi:hypothetical protein [Brachybacterium alimentarium]|uniref:Uncharacterized protein n=1 Tax=Brachybacterium alimentarium TaxID=47845 RepID=A0A2A3YEQ3_9MICO|nr:hypothetical protein [Brachybacterium alimentarium]PCC38252.1 hypothetical protein CIK66_14535 [Brachybacterium alimentarium]RCS74290.1 hypothetical protein CIK68_08560 [Brachybacterium alimentarium]RCS82330.1 hypothetical protein CIK67_13970 [Brachybacterium alimentarium]